MTLYEVIGLIGIIAISLGLIYFAWVAVNYPASKMRSFGWVYTVRAVPYHHGRVHSAPTPAYPAI